MDLLFYNFRIKILLFVSTVFVLLSCSGEENSFDIKDYYIDDSNQGRIVFFFIETSVKDSAALGKQAEKIFQTHEAYANVDSGKLKVIMAHFYSTAEIGEVPEADRQRIIADYGGEENFLSKVKFVKNGFMYAGFSRKIGRLDIPVNKVFPSPFIVPADGFKAAEIIAARKRK